MGVSSNKISYVVITFLISVSFKVNCLVRCLPPIRNQVKRMR